MPIGSKTWLQESVRSAEETIVKLSADRTLLRLTLLALNLALSPTPAGTQLARASSADGLRSGACPAQVLRTSLLLTQQADLALSQGKKQLAAWLYLEAGDATRSQRITAEIETELSTIPIPLSQGKRLTVGNRTAVYEFEDADLIVKTGGHGHTPESEVAAYRLDQLLGLNRVPVTVLRELKDGSSSIQASVHRRLHFARSPEASHHVDRRDLDFFDYWIANPDRTSNRNVLVLTQDGGREAWIDHGLAFGGKIDQIRLPVQRPSESLLQKFKSLQESEISGAVKGLLDESQTRELLQRRDFLLQRFGL